MSAYRAPTCRSLFTSTPGVIFPSPPLLLPLISFVFPSKVHLKFRCFEPPAESRARVWSACGCTECDNSAVTFIMMFYCLLQGKVPLLSPPPTQPSAEAVKGQGQHSSGRDRLPPGSSRGLGFFFLTCWEKEGVSRICRLICTYSDFNIWEAFVKHGHGSLFASHCHMSGTSSKFLK